MTQVGSPDEWIDSDTVMFMYVCFGFVTYCYLRAHDEAETHQVTRHVIVDRAKVFDTGRGDVEGKTATRHEDAV